MESYAAFGEVNYDFTERLTATLGLRYTYEDKEGAYATQVFGGLDLTGLAPAVSNRVESRQALDLPSAELHGRGRWRQPLRPHQRRLSVDGRHARAT